MTTCVSCVLTVDPNGHSSLFPRRTPRLLGMTCSQTLTVLVIVWSGSLEALKDVVTIVVVVVVKSVVKSVAVGLS